ncbi:uncharacterized protein T551_00211 [Pneumocystis jirovecii RU7]|uniref:RNA polymerase II-associated protein 3 n=1 Tax=Pneumocystis jirovecii (strain RU7) TaxID=1408657 RepID=A0A0W4ZWG9_PNEJ7|nr:uncharacterized protein T551_00211 [Pneumocystis jirovecii RU7]KTW32726.1 hypothetical protein T551_00211 [Pneumocystis jirovecii RU7]
MSVHKYKQQADAAYKRGDFDTAVVFYTKALQKTSSDLRLWTNRAQTFLQLQRWQEAIKDCTLVLEKDPTHQKALFRRGKAYAQLGEVEAARKDWKYLQTLQPENQAVINALNELEQNCAELKQKKDNEDDLTCIKKHIYINEVDALPPWAENDSKQPTNTLLKPLSWNKLETPTLQTLTQKLRTTCDTEASQHDRLIYFFLIDATTLPRLFGTAGLEGIFLETFLHAIEHVYIHAENRKAWWKQSLALLEQLSVCARFDIAILFVKKTTLERLDQLLQQAANEPDRQSYQAIWKAWMCQKSINHS